MTLHRTRLFSATSTLVASSLFIAGSDAADLLAYFNFDDATNPLVAVEQSGNTPNADLVGPAAFTADTEGFSGAAGDRALDLGGFNNSAYAQTSTGPHLDLAVTLNAMSVAWWQYNNGDGAGGFDSTSSFWLVAPAATGGERGFQSHAPWSNGTIFFDQSGCCDTPGQRLTVASGVIAGTWQHFVVQRDADGNQEIWVDGTLAAAGVGAEPLDPFSGVIIIGGSPNGGNSFSGLIDDFAVLAGTLTEAEIGQLAAGASPSDVGGEITDEDADGLPDVYEELFFPGDLTKLGPGDFDNDGADDLDEFANGTDPTEPDTDMDGLEDGAETNTGTYASATDTGTDPKNPDSDGDGLLDGVEDPNLPFVDADQPGTDPNLKDTDGDNFEDLVEIERGSDPTDSNSVPPPPELTLLAYFNFDGNLSDQTGNTPDAVLGGPAVLTTDGSGLTGSPGDEALFLGTVNDGSNASTPGGSHLDAAFINNAMAVTFWQFQDTVGNTSAFWIHSPDSDGNERGFQAHTPWSNGTVYFDQSGCCDPPERLTTTGAVTGAWQHFVFQRDTDGNREIWIDGTLAASAGGADPLDSFNGLITIGAEGTAKANSFAGRIDHFGIFATALDAAQIAELASGTPPPDLISPPIPFAITSITHDAASGATTIEWNSRPNRVYAIDSSDDLTLWSELDDGVESEGETTSYSEDLPVGTRRKYYQVREID